MRVVYLAHRYSDDPKRNEIIARMWYKWIIEQGFCPVAPWLNTIKALNNNDPKEKDLGKRLNFAIIPLCDELWLCGKEPPENSLAHDEVAHAHKHGLKIRSYTQYEYPPGIPNPSKFVRVGTHDKVRAALSPKLRKVYDIALIKDVLGTSDVMHQLDITTQSASNRLATLSRMQILRKVYKRPTPGDNAKHTEWVYEVMK